VRSNGVKNRIQDNLFIICICIWNLYIWYIFKKVI